MFTVLPRNIPVPLAYSPSLSSDKPTMVVVLGRALEGCTLEFGDGTKTHLQKSDERFLVGIVTVSDEMAEKPSSTQMSVLDEQGNAVAQYTLSVAPSSQLKKSDPLPTNDALLFEGASRRIEEIPASDFTIDLASVPGQQFLGPTANDSAVYDLRGELPSSQNFNWFNFEIIIADFYIILPIINEVYLFPLFDGGGATLASPILAQVGKLFPVRGSGILFAVRFEITIHVTIILIISIIFDIFPLGLFNEFPGQFPQAIATVIFEIRIEIEIIITFSFLSALVLPDGSLRLIFVFNLTIGIDFTLSSDGRRLNFESNFSHSVRFFSILPFNDPLPCNGRFQLADDNGQTVFTDSFGGRQSYYFARSAGECCIPWRFNLELVRFGSGGGEEIIQPGFDASMCITAEPNPNLINIIITSNPPPQGIPPTLMMNIADTARLTALAQSVDENGNPNGPLQDVRSLGYEPEFYLELPPALLDPNSLLPGDAFAIQSGQNIIRVRTSSVRVLDEEGTLYNFWFGGISGFDIIRFLAEGQVPRVLFAALLPLQVNANANTIRVEPVLAYRDSQNNLVATPPFSNNLQPATETWELERYEPFETTQREFVLAVKVDIPSNVTLPQTLNFTVNPAIFKQFGNMETMAVVVAPLSKIVNNVPSPIFGGNRNSNKPNEFFTGRLVEATSTSTVTASLTINTRPSPNELIEVSSLKIQPNVKEADATTTTPKKLVPPGKSVTGKNVLLTIPLMCRASSSNVSVSFPKPELNVVVRNDETFEEYLRVFKEVQTILSGAGNNFNNFANGLFTALTNRGNTPIADVLKPQGETLWNNANNLVQGTPNPYLDDRPLYWARLQGIGAIRAYVKRNNLSLNNSDLNKFEWTSRGLDVTDGSIKFTGAPAGVRKVIVTGFDPFGLTLGSVGNSAGNDYVESSNPSGLIALFFNGQPADAENQGDVYIRSVIFPVRYQDFNDRIVENAIMQSLGAIMMLLTISQNGGQNYYDVERWAARFRVNGIDNNNKQGGSFPIDPNGNHYLESTLPFELVITASESLEGPMGLTPFVIDQSFKSNGVNRNRRERRDLIIPPSNDYIEGVFRAEPLLQDTAGHRKVDDVPLGTSEEGSGSNFLSNEVFYRVALKRNSVRPNPNLPGLASGHFHVPPTGFDPTVSNGTGARLIRGARNALRRFFEYGFRFIGPNSIAFPVTIINATAEKMLTVTNNSTETLRIGTVDIAAPFSVVLPTPLPITINAGVSVALTLRFTPIAVGLQTRIVTMRELSGEILLKVDLSGGGIESQPVPVISGFSPTVVFFGDSVTISGQYFTQTTEVKVGNTPVNYEVVSDTQISIDAEATTGRITVVSVFGTAMSSETLRVRFRPPEDL